MAEDDILFRASVDDQTIQFFERFDKHLNRIADNSDKAFKTVEQGSKRSEVAIGAVAGVVASLSAKLLDMAMQAGRAFTSYIKEATALRARVDTLGVTLNVVGQKAGYSADQIASAEEELKALGITTSAARTALMQMTRANIDWSEASKLARLAQDAAVVAGINSSQAFERLIRGIQKQEPELLDELGITLRRTDAYEALAEELGKNARELTRQEQSQAILNEIYRQSAVVAGSYEASMGSVGKQVTSLPRYFEELQLAIGGAFQEAYAKQVEFITEKVKALHAWVVENEDALQEFGAQLARALELAFNLIDKLGSGLAKFPGMVEQAGVALAKMVSTMDDAQVEAQAEQYATMETFQQWLSITYGFLAALGTVIQEIVAVAAGGFAATFKALRGEDITEYIRDLNDRLRNIGETSKQAWSQATVDAAEFFGLIQAEAPAAEQAVEDLNQTMDDVQEPVEDSSDALRQADKALQDFYDRMQEDIEMRAIQRMREETEEALRLSHQLEDIERNYQRSLAKIRADFQKEQRELQQDGQEEVLKLYEERNERALEIEEEHQRRLRELQERYELEAGELARQRDAIGLLRLMRRHQQELIEEERTVEERRRQNEESFNEQMENIRERLQEQNEELRESFEEQMAMLEEQRKQQLEDLELQLKRQRELQELHRQWEEEDRQRAYEKELQELGEHFAGIEGLTEEGLAEVLGAWDGFLDDLSIIRDEYMAISAELASADFLGPGFKPGTGGLFPSQPTHPPGGGQGTIGSGGTIPGGEAGGIFGQAGQLSLPLANPSTPAFNLPSYGLMQQIPRLPASGAHNRTSIEKRVVISADGLEPLIQRQVVAVLTELERNR